MAPKLTAFIIMTIYRAVPRSEFEPGRAIGRIAGRRLPGNVSYLVDNLWEFARPAQMPSRRHAVYASPTPELALKNASAGGLPRDQYVACRVEFRYEPLMFQLSVEDARDHPDVGRLQKLVNRELASWAAGAAGDKLALATLFMPGVTRVELLAAMEGNALLRSIVEKAAASVTLWDALKSPPAANGELIFEIADDNEFTLHPVGCDAVCR